ncbi:serine arginine-rich splicing factor [Phlyctochytrium planicorne]|nr:serine arginine-rich splicing factor [Phlyctochytrium planicorne]
MSSSRLYLGKLSRDAREDDVRTLFEVYGKVDAVTLKNGFGFVDFATQEQAEKAAYDLHGSSFFGERLIVEISTSEKNRAPSRIVEFATIDDLRNAIKLLDGRNLKGKIVRLSEV